MHSMICLAVEQGCLSGGMVQGSVTQQYRRWNGLTGDCGTCTDQAKPVSARGLHTSRDQRRNSMTKRFAVQSSQPSTRPSCSHLGMQAILLNFSRLKITRFLGYLPMLS